MGDTCAPCGARLALAEGKWPSLSSLDRRICSLFFYWSTWNVFLGAMLGGSAFSQLGIIINNPAAITRIIGTALPASSNFFINYVIIQVALALLGSCCPLSNIIWPSSSLIKALPGDTWPHPHAVADINAHTHAIVLCPDHLELLAGAGYAVLPAHVPSHWLPHWPLPPLRVLQ